MKRSIALFSLLAAFLCMQGCGPKAFTKGGYDDPNRVELLDDKFNEADLQQMADKIVGAMIECPEIKDSKARPTIAVSKVNNRTEELIDIESLNEKIRTNLSKSRKVRFVDRGSRGEIDTEVEFGETGKQSRESAKKHGKQVAVDYLMTGALATNIQQVGNDKLIYYKLTMNLTNTDTSVIDCTEEHEIRKKYRKQSMGLF
jgi:penicillin-binding protein activator